MTSQSSSDKALRFNSQKLRWNLLPVECLEELIKILTKGAVKYGDFNWKKSLNTSDHSAFFQDRIESIYRHLAEIRKGEKFDEESLEYDEERPNGVAYTDDEVDIFNKYMTTHAGAVAVNALFLLYYTLHEKSMMDFEL